MKWYGIATKGCRYNLKCMNDLTPLIFTDFQIAKDGCEESEEVVELVITVKEVVKE